jgi:hypothetical protein
MARLFAAGHWREGCDKPCSLYDKGTVRGRRTVLSWLVAARERERKICLIDHGGVK